MHLFVSLGECFEPDGNGFKMRGNNVRQFLPKIWFYQPS